MCSESCSVSTVSFWLVYQIKWDQGTPLLNPFNVTQSKCQGLTMSWSALCDLIAATQLLPTTLYSDLNIADNPHPQSLALLVSFVWNALFKLFFGLSPSTGLSSDDICSLAYVIILYRISNHPPPTSTQTFGIS